jgi:CRP-like cAMP-binding protein
MGKTAMQTVFRSHANLVLQRLPHDEFALMEPHLAAVSLLEGQVLLEAGQPVRHVFFPTTGIVSLISLHADGSTVELASVGSEGLVGLSALTGPDPSAQRCEVRHRGRAWRIPAAELRALYPRLPALQRQTMQYMQLLLTQVGQTAACICHQPLMAQLCRWILLTLDRMQGNELSITQQKIADMLGVRREGVTEAVGKLKELQLLDHSRGRITILDRAGLEAISGEFYADGDRCNS